MVDIDNLAKVTEDAQKVLETFGCIADLKAQLAALQTKYNRLIASNNGLAVEIALIRKEKETWHNRYNLAVAIIANTANYVDDNEKIDKRVLLTFLDERLL